MDPILTSLTVCLLLGLLVSSWGSLRATLSIVFEILADIARPGGEVGYAEARNLLWALGITDRSTRLASERHLEEFARLLQNRVYLESQADRDRSDLGAVSPHLEGLIRDADRDLAAVRWRVAQATLGPDLTASWRESLREGSGPLPYLPGEGSPGSETRRK